MAFRRKKHPVNWHVDKFIEPAYYRLQKTWTSNEEYHIVKFDVMEEGTEDVVDVLTFFISREKLPKPTAKRIYEHMKKRVEFKISESV